MIKIGDEVIIKDPHWIYGENIGNRPGEVVSVEGYILVNVYAYHSNPVKCFQYEVFKVEYQEEDEQDISIEDDDIEDWVTKLFNSTP